MSASIGSYSDGALIWVECPKHGHVIDTLSDRVAELALRVHDHCRIRPDATTGDQIAVLNRSVRNA